MNEQQLLTLMADTVIYQFLQDWALQILTAVSVLYLIRMSKQRRNTEKLIQIKVDSIAFALGKTSIGETFTEHYESEVEKRIEQDKYVQNN